MDKDKLWELYLQKNPHWATGPVHLTANGLRKFVEQVWRHGYQYGIQNTNVRFGGGKGQ